jgi:hypothetical protein
MPSAIHLQLVIVIELAAENIREIENYFCNKVSKIPTGGAGAMNGEDYKKKNEVLNEISKFLSDKQCFMMKN